MSNGKGSAYTFTGNGKLTKITSDVVFMPTGSHESDVRRYRSWTGIWDTGASATCIRGDVALSLGLVCVGTSAIGTANGRTKADVYMVDMWMPNGILIPNLPVYAATLNGNIDALIGMDIIGNGDLAITNYVNTMLSFRMPSRAEIDFVEVVKKDKEVGAAYMKTLEKENYIRKESIKDALSLMAQLIKDGRAADIERALSDEAYERQLFAEYGLTV